MRCLVTGGAGFIGSHLVEALVARGHEVTVLDNLSTGHRENLAAVADRITFIEGSILDTVALERASAGAGCIFHLAAVVSVPQSVETPLPVHETNLTGTLKVFEAARAVGARVVFSSSAAVYGEDPTLPKREEMSTVPVSPYGVQKLAGEEYLRAYAHLHRLPGVALRYFNVYGPRQDPRSPYSGVISIFSERALQGREFTIFGDGQQTRDFVYVADVVAANLRAMESPHADGRAYNIGTGRSVSLNELAQTILAITGSPSVVSYGPPRAGDILHSLSDPGRAAAELGFEAGVELREGLRQTLPAPPKAPS